VKGQKHRRQSIMRRVKRRVVIDPFTGCWVWQGPTSGNGRGGGYGRMSLNGRTVAVHIVVFTHFFGYVPGNRQVDHRCTNRLCCNPDHLLLVTHKTNQRLRAQRSKTNGQEE
jgi:hypothetical protein